ncbi:MAG TPA: hypothetical protein ENJ09_05490 [Planctomycetes bacterium]|nr:hypothetical protein [Planctomycetota bacterium]
MRQRIRRSRFFASCLLTIIATGALPQAQVTEQAPRRLLDSLGLRGGTVQRLVLPWTEGQPFETSLELGGIRRQLIVAPYDMRSADFKIVGLDDQGEHELLQVAPTTYRGSVVGVPDSVVAVTLYQGQLSGIVLMDNEIWAVQPATEGFAWLPRTAHVVYRQDQMKGLAERCGVADAPLAGGAREGGGFPDAPQNAEIALELEPRFVNKWGGLSNATNQVMSIMNGVDAIYQRDTNIAYTITRIVFRDAGYSSNSTAVLNQMQNLWKAKALEVTRDMAQLFMGNSGSGVLGVSYLGTVCNANNHYSVVWHTNSLTARIAVSAHELGHTWSAGHCDNISQCFIMCAFIGGCSGVITSFAPVSINQISNFAATRTCLN